MYLPSHFEQHDTATLHALMRAHPLATLVSLGDDGAVRVLREQGRSLLAVGVRGGRRVLVAVGVFAGYWARIQ